MTFLLLMNRASLNKSKHACYEQGKGVEIHFSGLAEKEGFSVEECSKEENMFQHIDFRITNEYGTVSLDVKSRKKRSRSDDSYDDEWVWLEFKNVNGDDGWMYGKSDYIVFEREVDFILVPRIKLLNWSLEAMRKHNPTGEKAKSTNSAKYKLYKRFRRKDSITQVELQKIIDEIDGIKVWKKRP